MKKLFAAGCLLLPHAAALADPAAWDQHWKDCKDFRLPMFQVRLGEVKTLLAEGKAWEGRAQNELRELQDVADVTCKKWAENPNGREPLAEFVRRYSAVSVSALTLQAQAKELIEPKLAKFMKLETVELAALGMKLESFACGQSFQRSRQRVMDNLAAVERSFAALKTKCPKAADDVIAKARAEGLKAKPHSYGNGGRTPAGSHPRQQSDITGTKPLNGGRK